MLSLVEMPEEKGKETAQKRIKLLRRRFKKKIFIPA
jgi:hypothetical protein